MSVPVVPDFATIKMGDGATPEGFTLICGIETPGLNETAQTQDRFRRDCAKPGRPAQRFVRVTGTQWDLTGSGVVNVDEIARVKAAVGVRKNYEVELRQDNDTDEGLLLGTYEGTAVMTAFNWSGGDEASAEITLAGEGEIEWDIETPTP